MIHGQRLVVVMPAYNAERTLEKTFREIPLDLVDQVILTDDASADDTVALALSLGIETHVHTANQGYGANQKTCYQAALDVGGDIVVMLHPDYQYTPRLLTAMASLIALDVYDVVIGSRILGRGAAEGGMPRYKYVANRLLTLVQNLLVGQKLSEFHTGYRAFSRQVLAALPLLENSDDFVFDNQMLCQVIYQGFRIGEVSCPTHYSDDSSSIGLRRACAYGVGVLMTSLRFRLARWGLLRSKVFGEGRTLESD